MVIVQPGGSSGDGGGSGYTLPPATQDTLGGIKVGENLTVEADGTLNATGGGGGGGYVLPPATANTLGGIKVGQNLTVEEDGTLNAQAGSAYVLPPATADTLGGVKIGSGIEVTADGTISVSGGGSGGGGDEWEELDLSNLPTDFAVGDRLKIYFKITPNVDNPSDWNTAPTTPSYPNTNQTECSPIEYTLRSANIEGPNALISVSTQGNAISIIVGPRFRIDGLNGSGYGIYATTVIFNGGGRAQIDSSYNRNAMANVISRMYRIKSTG